MAGGGAALSRVSSRGRLAAPYPTVPYSTVPYGVLPDSRNIRQSISYPVSLKESQGERKPLWETGENVENSVENLLQGAQAAAGGRGCGGQPDGYFRPDVVRRGRSGGQERCAMAWMRWGRRRFWRRPGAAEHGAVPTGGMCGCGRGFWPGPVWRVLSAGAGVVDAFGWRVVVAVRCGTRVQRGARWLAFFPREKMLDKLCKSILNCKQRITQAAAGDGLRHCPHRRSCSVYPTSTSSVAAWPPRHLPRIAKGDARSHPRRALPPRAPSRVCASHVHLIRRGVAAAPPSPHRQRRCTISSEAGLAPSDSPAGVRIPRPPHPSRRLRSCAARSTRAFPALPSAKRRRKTPPRIEPMLGGVL